MTQGSYFVEYNRALTKDVREMRLLGDTSAITAPGQFVNIQLDGLFLRRPISVCDWDSEGLIMIYKVVGKGTAALGGAAPGAKLDVLCGLGNGFDVSRCGGRTLVIGGGVGTPPMYGLAKALLKAGKTPIAILGFNTREEIFCPAWRRPRPACSMPWAFRMTGWKRSSRVNCRNCPGRKFPLSPTFTPPARKISANWPAFSPERKAWPRWK